MGMSRSVKVMKCGKNIELQKALFCGSGRSSCIIRDKSLVWLQDQVECNMYNLSLLQSLREIAARERFNGLRQCNN